MMGIDKIAHKISLLHSASTETPTSFKLAEEIINKIDVDWSNPDLRILDPHCGRGTFLLALIKKLESHGHSRLHIISEMIYATDVSKVQYMITIKALTLAGGPGITAALLLEHIVNEDSLIKEWGMKFDVVVGNPPFQETKEDGDRKDQASNLWSKFWALSIKRLTKSDSIIALITPTSWLSPSADLTGKNKIEHEDRLWNVFNKHTSYANVVDVSKHFQGVGSSFGYVIVDKKGTAGLKFSDGADTSLGFLPRSNFAKVKQELSQTDNIGSHFAVDQDNDPGGIRVSIPMTRKIIDSSIEILQGVASPTSGSDKDALYIYVHVQTQEQADKIKARVIDCLDILNTDCKWSGFLNIKILKLISYTE
jgi:23S rRNA A1618 N6-methylase RlmF